MNRNVLIPNTLLAGASATLMLIVAACGQPAVMPAPQLGQAPVQAASQASPSAPAPAQAGETIISLNPGNAIAQYQTQEQLAGRNLPNMAVGSTSGVSGSIALTPDGQLDSAASKITVDLSSLKSDETMRDKFIKGNTLQTAQFPEATFVPTVISGLEGSLPSSGSATFKLTGDLTVHGVTQPVTWTVTAQFDNGQMSGKATAPFTITEFGMSIPKAGPVLSVQDAGTLELDFSNVALAS